MQVWMVYQRSILFGSQIWTEGKECRTAVLCRLRYEPSRARMDCSDNLLDGIVWLFYPEGI